MKVKQKYARNYSKEKQMHQEDQAMHESKHTNERKTCMERKMHSKLLLKELIHFLRLSGTRCHQSSKY
jgi:hypothetical protein